MKALNFTPLVGILASKGKTAADTFRGNSSTYKLIQKKLTKIGGLSYVFTLDNIKENCVTGFIYDEDKNKWGKLNFPFPDVIYNKISTRSEEASPVFHQLRNFYKIEGKYFFNPCFFNKWDTFKTLSNSHQLIHHLPKTWLFTSIYDLLNKLNQYRALYLKPVNGHSGKGIYKLSFDGQSYYLYQGREKHCYTMDRLIPEIQHQIENTPYIIQVEVKTDKIDGCKYDLRVLGMFEETSYKVIGTGIRRASMDSIITHVPNGGEIISFSEFKGKCSETFLDLLTKAVGVELSRQYGFIGEFSLDIGLTRSGKPVIFEVNSKPMTFDEEDIQKRRIAHLVHLFKKLPDNVNDIRVY